MAESGGESGRPPLRVVPSPQVAPHGHLIQAQHETVLPAEEPSAAAALSSLLETSGTPPPPGARKDLQRICGVSPSFLDGWARLAEVEYAGDDPVSAYACARVGYHRGLDRLRKHGWGGTGQVRWSRPSNRGFLRSLFMLMLAAASLGEIDEAARCQQFLVDLDPDDALGAATWKLPPAGELADAARLP